MVFPTRRRAGDFTPGRLTAVALRRPVPDPARRAAAWLDSLDVTEADLDAELLAEAEHRDRALVADPASGWLSRARATRPSGSSYGGHALSLTTRA